jgi:nicotinate phosphoribosyltransferase
MGTIAHEMQMIYSALHNEDIALAQNTLLNDWYELYGGPGSIALIDTYGTDFFFQNLSMKHIINYWGARIDSGDPLVIGENVLKYYRDAGIDPMGKMILFSDGLTVPKMIELYQHFSQYVKVGFGIGTNLSSDLGGRNLSIVIKAVEANSRGLVKLSDNIEKSIGTSEDIERYKQLVGYNNQFSETPIY